MITRSYLFLLALLLALATAGQATAAEKGVVTDLTWNLGQQTAERESAVVHDLGAQWATVDLSWRNAEPSDDAYSSAELENLDRAIALARAAGARVLLTVNEAPAWASGHGDVRYPPSDPAKLAEFYGMLVARYANSVDAWQVWNEPNHPHYWQPDPTSDPNACATYAGMLKAVAPVIRAGDPTGRVLFAGLAWNDYAYLERCLELTPDLPASFDAMVTHPYAMAGAAPETQRDTAPADGRLDYQTFLAYREIRRTLVDRGAPRPIWFTEMGWSTCRDNHPLGCVSPEVQADYLTRAYKLLEQDDYVQVAIWYGLRNIGNDGPSWLDQLGLHSNDFTPKPAATAFRAYQPPQPPAGQEPVPGAPAPVASDPVVRDPDGSGPASGPAVTPTTSTTLRVRRLPRSRRARVDRILLSGRVVGAAAGSVTLQVQRRGADRVYRTSLRVTAKLSRTGTFTRTVSRRGGVRWRARAIYAGRTGTKPSTSRFVAFRTRR